MERMQRGERKQKVTIFQTSRDENKMKLNAFLNTPMASDYLAMLALSRGRAKSTLIRDIVDDWYQRESKKVDIDALLEKVVTIAENRWFAARTQEVHKTFEGYLLQLQKELEKKKVSSNYIQLIIKKLHEKNQERINQQAGER